MKKVKLTFAIVITQMWRLAWKKRSWHWLLDVNLPKKEKELFLFCISWKKATIRKCIYFDKWTFLLTEKHLERQNFCIWKWINVFLSWYKISRIFIIVFKPNLRHTIVKSFCTTCNNPEPIPVHSLFGLLNTYWKIPKSRRHGIISTAANCLAKMVFG